MKTIPSKLTPTAKEIDAWARDYRDKGIVINMAAYKRRVREHIASAEWQKAAADYQTDGVDQRHGLPAGAFACEKRAALRAAGLTDAEAALNEATACLDLGMFHAMHDVGMLNAYGPFKRLKYHFPDLADEIHEALDDAADDMENDR